MWLTLDEVGPLHRQTYRALRTTILSGRLAPGQRLPSTRGLAADLGVSRTTILQAYEQLVAEGYATARSGSGTRVVDSLPKNSIGAHAPGRVEQPRQPPRLSSYARRSVGSPQFWNPLDRAPFDFRFGEPALADFPLTSWGRYVSRHARGLSQADLANQPPGGVPALREALASYLARSRGVACEPEQILVVNGSQQAIDLVARLLIDPGDRVALEEPRYYGFAASLQAAGAELYPVPVDDEGLRIDALPRSGSPRLCCVTPSHQFPTGAVLSLPRRLGLLEWARRHDCHIVEDDFDGEFRYDGAPIESLQSLDREGRVIYIGTSSKALFPALRIGWLVAPPVLVPHFHTIRGLADGGPASLEQRVLASFIQEGLMERHIARSRRRYAERRAALLDALADELGDRALVSGASAGLHVLVRLPELPASLASELWAACARLGVGVYPAGFLYANPPDETELLLGYTAISKEAIRGGVKRLRSALEALRRE